MTPPARILVGDVRASLAELPPDRIHCIVTSPPYWRLRSYLPADHTLKPLEMGSEATPEEYVSNLVAVLRLARAALHPSGILWLNLGDSYASSCGLTGVGPGALVGNTIRQVQRGNTRGIPNDLKPKDLVGIPWRVALALQADGWYWRSWLPWVKRSAMPSSVIDRPGSACEVWFMFTKSPRYFYDYFAVRVGGEKGKRLDESRSGRNFRDADLLFESIKTPHGLIADEDGEPLALDVTNRGSKIPHFAMFPEKLVEPLIRAGTSEKGCCPKCYAPWTRVAEKVRTATRPGVNTCIEGTTAAEHGNRDPERHVTEFVTLGWYPSCACENLPVIDAAPRKKKDETDEGYAARHHAWSDETRLKLLNAIDKKTLLCVVLDPFCGAGTTLVVAQRLGRAGVGCELNPEFAGFARGRLANCEVDGSGNGVPGEPATGRALPCEIPRAVPRLPLLRTTP